MSDAIQVIPRAAIARAEELTAEDVIAQVQKIQDVMARVMKDGDHYGVIPGTNKPFLDVKDGKIMAWRDYFDTAGLASGGQ